MITADAAAIEAKYANKSGPVPPAPIQDLYAPGVKGSGPPTAQGQIPQGTPIPEGVVIQQVVGRGQPAPSMAVVPPKAEGGPPAPQIAMVPPTGSTRTTLGTLVDLQAPVSRTTSNPLAVEQEPQPEQPAPKPERKPLDLPKEILTHMWELGGPKSKQCQEFYDRSDQTLNQWQKNPGAIPLEAVLKFLKKNHGVKEAFMEELEPHFAFNDQEGWAESLPNRGKMDCVICSPILGQPTMPYHWTTHYLVKKYELGETLVHGDTAIWRSRNMLAHRFLASGARWSLWLDSDMGAPIGKPEFYRWLTRSETITDEACRFDVLQRLLSHNKAIIGAVYASRIYHGQLVIQPDVRPRSHEDRLLSNEIRRGTARGLAGVDWIGFGCALIHREVFLEVQRRFPDLAPQAEFAPWRFFQPVGDEGEDEAFCQRARACSIPIWLDTQLVCGHVGNFMFLPEHTQAKMAL